MSVETGDKRPQGQGEDRETYKRRELIMTEIASATSETKRKRDELKAAAAEAMRLRSSGSGKLRSLRAMSPCEHDDVKRQNKSGSQATDDNELKAKTDKHA